MSQATLYIGDVFDVMATIPDGSVDLVLTSPPFLALRSYLPADHPDKDKEIGSEPTPAAFLDTMLALSAEWRRLLAPHGSICVELGDTYAGSGGAGGDYADGGMRDGQPKFRQTSGWHRGKREGRNEGAAYRKAGTEAISPNGGSGWPLDKSLCGIPTLYAWSLAYGRNLLTGQPSPAGQWRVRNVVAWCRPNPPVGALGDKVRPATSYITMACASRQRHFDLDAVRTEHVNPRPQDTNGAKNAVRLDGQGHGFSQRTVNPGGAPPLDHWWHDDVFAQDAWLIPTQPYKGSHYATWPEDLLIRPIEAMCPRKVCTVCGKPSERIMEITGYTDSQGRDRTADALSWQSSGANGNRGKNQGRTDGGVITATATTGWSDCGHDSWRNGIVLDPFAGSGTTLAVAVGHGRDAIGIDLDARNADLARERCGLFLTVESPRGVA